MDIRKMSLWIKVENKLKSEAVVMDVEGWNHHWIKNFKYKT